MPTVARKARPAIETYEQVSQERKGELRSAVLSELGAIRTRLMALASNDAERAIVAQEYLQQHTAGSKVDATVMGHWSDSRLVTLEALQQCGLTRTDLAGHLGLTLPRVGQILMPTTGGSRQEANRSGAVRRAPEGGPVGRPVRVNAPG